MFCEYETGRGSGQQGFLLSGRQTQPDRQTNTAAAGIYGLGGKDEKTGQIILKAVNPGPAPLDTTVCIDTSG